MRLWLQAMYLLCSQQEGYFSSNQLHRTLGVTLKTAWFMSHRIREAMRVVGVAPMGGEGEIVEADETYYRPREGQPRPRGCGPQERRAVPCRAWRFRPQLPCRRHHDRRDHAIVRENIARETTLMTDEAHALSDVGDEFAEPRNRQA